MRRASLGPSLGRSDVRYSEARLFSAQLDAKRATVIFAPRESIITHGLAFAGPMSVRSITCYLRKLTIGVRCRDSIRQFESRAR